MPRELDRQRALEVFFQKVTPGHAYDCWVSRGRKDTNGYSQQSIGGKLWQLHRVAHELFIGPIPDDLEVDHLCFNRPCVNPYHLEAVTHLENMRRAHARRVYVRDWSSPVCKNGHRWTPENTITTVRDNRACRQCHRDRNREYQRRKREEAA